MKRNFICSKKSVRTFKLRIEPYFFEPRGAWKNLLNSGILGGNAFVSALRADPISASDSDFQFWRRGGIRTPDAVSRIPVFETGAFDHSATSPTNISILYLNLITTAVCLWPVLGAAHSKASSALKD
jgi:hypothetical protein